MKLIGFAGGMGVGKTTAILMLEDLLGYPLRLEKFAGMLYQFQDYIYDSIEATGAYKRPQNFVKDRKLLQWLGTEWGRQTISENIWTDIWKAKVTRALNHNHFVVCDDVRFNNEATLVRQMGGVVVKLVSEKSQKRIDTTSGLVNHRSEAGVSPGLVDFVIENNGTKEELKAALEEVLFQMKGIDNGTSASG